MITLQYTAVLCTFVGRSLKQIRLFKRNPSVQAFKEIFPSLTPLKGKITFENIKSVSKHFICLPTLQKFSP